MIWVATFLRNDNRYRSIILAKGGRYWVYEYLFAKQDRDNIDADELAAFRVLAKNYAELSEVQILNWLNKRSLWRYAMTIKRKYKSEAFEAIHSLARALVKVGAIDKATMREFDQSCLAMPPEIAP